MVITTNNPKNIPKKIGLNIISRLKLISSRGVTDIFLFNINKDKSCQKYFFNKFKLKYNYIINENK